MTTITRRDFIKLGCYSFVGVFLGQRWPVGWLVDSERDLPGQFNNWGQSNLTIGGLEIAFNYLPPFPPYLKKGGETE